LNTAWQYFSAIPEAFKSRPGEWLLIPVFHIFGSEELSRKAHGISQLLPRPYLALSPADVSIVGAAAGEQLRVVIDDSQFEVEVVLRADLPRGLAGVPSGVPPFESVQLPTFCKLLPVESEMSARGVL
jgi:NADH-quinone oxidoreductase subunit G